MTHPQKYIQDFLHYQFVQGDIEEIDDEFSLFVAA